MKRTVETSATTKMIVGHDYLEALRGAPRQLLLACRARFIGMGNTWRLLASVGMAVFLAGVVVIVAAMGSVGSEAPRPNGPTSCLS